MSQTPESIASLEPLELPAKRLKGPIKIDDPDKESSTLEPDPSNSSMFKKIDWKPQPRSAVFSATFESIAPHEIPQRRDTRFSRRAAAKANDFRTMTLVAEQDVAEQELPYVLSELTRMVIKHQGVVPELFTRNSQVDATSLAQNLEANDDPEDSDDDEWVNVNEEGIPSRSIQIISRQWRMSTGYWEEYFGQFCDVRFESTRILLCHKSIKKSYRRMEFVFKDLEQSRICYRALSLHPGLAADFKYGPVP